MPLAAVDKWSGLGVRRRFCRLSFTGVERRQVGRSTWHHMNLGAEWGGIYALGRGTEWSVVGQDRIGQLSLSFVGCIPRDRHANAIMRVFCI